MTKKITSFLVEHPDKPNSYKRLAEDFINEHLRKSEENSSNAVDELGLESLERDGEHTRLETELLRSRVDRYRQDTDLRKIYARRVYFFMVAYTFFMAVIVLLNGLPASVRLLDIPISLDINDVPLATLIGGAFASAVGLVAFVVKGLFPHDRRVDSEPASLRILLSEDKLPVDR